jgi:tRNA threonylcarbamoyladenosine biosynthesis protein TsaB
MRLIALNTASLCGRIALMDEHKVIAEKSWKTANNESEFLLPAIQELLKESNQAFKDIDKIVVISGPGPFTALG